MLTRSEFAKSWKLPGLAALACITGCSSESAPSGQPSEQNTASGWEELVAGDWQLAPGGEDYRCVRLTLPADVVVGAFKPLGPPGTHHTTLSIGEPKAPDGMGDCSAAATLAAGRGLWGSGVNTQAFDLPEGVGMVLEAGQQLLLNLHLYNTTQAPLSGHSGIAIRRIDRTRIEHEAGATLMGPVTFSLPAGMTTEVTGRCTLKQDGTVFAMLPHMHRTGRHMRVFAERAGMPDFQLYDGEFDFQEQLTYAVPNVTLGAGDHVRVECTYDNDTSRDMGFGESTNDEMCFAATALYPRIEDPACVQ